MNTPTIYQYLLRLLPRHVRRNYGDEMTSVFQERLQEKPGARPMLWIREAGSVIAAAFRTRIRPTTHAPGVRHRHVTREGRHDESGSARDPWAAGRGHHKV